jgi:histidinol-phosphate/aromatic aminotransferase/cobyric acid decarboxylase-like protein
VFCQSGDVVLTTVPGYPVLATHARYLGGEVIKLPLRAEHNFFPDLQAIDPRGGGTGPSCFMSITPTTRPARRRLRSSSMS